MGLGARKTMRITGMVALCVTLGGCAASKEQVAAQLGSQFVGQNVDALVVKFGPPANTFKMNSGDTSYIWQLGNQTNFVANRGEGVASTQFCKVSVIANKNGIVTQLNTEDANAGGGLYALTGALGSICANRLGIRFDRLPQWLLRPRQQVSMNKFVRARIV
jgi:hypothetical protein